MFTKVATAFVLIFVLSACTGGDKKPSVPDSPDASSSTGSGSNDGPSGPDCADIWKADKTLPPHYDGCVKGGKAGSEEAVKCKDDTSLIVFEEVFFAVTGGKIKKPSAAPLQDTEEYSTAYTACTGE